MTVLLLRSVVRRLVWWWLVITITTTTRMVRAFPSLLANDCDRSLQVGEIVMGFPIQWSDAAPPGQQHNLVVVAVDDDHDDDDSSSVTTKMDRPVCHFATTHLWDESDRVGGGSGGSAAVSVGEALLLRVDADLVQAVLTDGWTPGQGPNYIVEVSRNAILETDDNDTTTTTSSTCGQTRVVNPTTTTLRIRPLEAGTVTVRFLWAYAFGPVYAAHECTIPVHGSQKVVQHTGYLVDLASWSANVTTTTTKSKTTTTTLSKLSTRPYDLSVQQLLREEAHRSGYAVLAPRESPNEDNNNEFDEVGDDRAIGYDLRYQLAPTHEIHKHLQSLPANATNVQISLVGLLTSHSLALENNQQPQQPQVVGEPTVAFANVPFVQLLTLAACTDAATCPGYQAPVDDDNSRVCLADGLCVTSSRVNPVEGTITTSLISNDAAWFGVGFSTPGGGMTAGGTGADVFVCSADGLQRFLLTTPTNPQNSRTAAETLVSPNAVDQSTTSSSSSSSGLDNNNNEQNQDEFADDDDKVLFACRLDRATNTGRMTFTRGLSDAPRVIVPNEPQALVWARGPHNEQVLATRHDRRGEVSLDLTALAKEDGTSIVVVRVVRQQAEWILWCHIVCMALSWGVVLPLAVVVASRTRHVTGGRPGAWFAWHKQWARVGWFLQTVGILCAVYYCDIYNANHMQFRHSQLGAFVGLVGFLQPLSATVRPPKHQNNNNNARDGSKPLIGRIIFQVYHKGLGWTAMVCGLVNLFWGVRLVQDLDFEERVSRIPQSLGLTGCLLATGFFVVSVVHKDNVVSRIITGAATPPTTTSTPTAEGALSDEAPLAQDGYLD